MSSVELKFHLGFGITLFLAVQRSPRSCTQMPALSSQVHPKLLTHPHENLSQKSSLEGEKKHIEITRHKKIIKIISHKVTTLESQESPFSSEAMWNVQYMTDRTKTSPSE